ncbi:MAG: nicotinate (nicotinamide) nucleotide adenylyltransferase [Alphaproteobacteria bacterium]|nr:nicotinate (nicotinamide) nucleotide adenylyltransferase [Alphaproteobacteria bacterium]
MRRIGLLGGSFNPAHEGHLHITLEAIKRLGLDEVWWLVSPHNPLKKKADLAEYESRFASAQTIATHPHIKVLDIEARNALYYSIDTIRHLQRRTRGTQFVWLMGADNLQHFHRWRAWREIFARLPIAIIDRAPYAFSALHNLAALRYRHKRITNSRLLLRGKTLPAWAYISIPRHPQSATALRKSLGAKAFLRHNERT